MKYSKPEVTLVARATQAVQGSQMGKLHPTQVEEKTFGTPAAYEADE